MVSNLATGKNNSNFTQIVHPESYFTQIQTKALLNLIYLTEVSLKRKIEIFLRKSRELLNIQKEDCKL